MKWRPGHLVPVGLTLFAVLVASPHLDADRVQQPLRAVLVVPGVPADLEGLALLEQGTDEASRPVPFAITGSQPGQGATIEWDCAPGDYVVRTNTLVSRPVAMGAEHCGRPRVATVFRAATVTGRLVGTTDVAVPRALAVDVAVCELSATSGDLGTYRARIDADGAFSASIPAGCADLLVRAGAAAPLPFSHLVLQAGERRDLGTISLKRGATVSVPAVSESGEPIAHARAHVIPIADVERFVDAVVTGKTLPVALESQTGTGGVADFIGVPPGAACIAVSSDGRYGFAGPVDLRASEFARLSPVLVTPGGTATVTVTGDRSWLSSDGGFYAVAWPVVGGIPVISARVRFGLPDGENFPRPLPFAGLWRFELHSGSATILDRQDVQLEPGANAVVLLSAGQLMFSGRVLLGDQPKPGLLRLKPRETETTGTVDTPVDVDGRFRVALPRPGLYLAAFTSSDNTVRFPRAEVDFVPSREILIRYASTSVTGVVVHADGTPASRAMVLVTYPAARWTSGPLGSVDMLPPVQADESGAFSLPFLQPGEWNVRARLRTLVSDTQPVVVRDAGTVPVRLVLRREAGLTIQVTDAAGKPVPNAMGIVMAASGGIPATQVQVTDRDGTYKAVLEGSDESAVTFLVAADGYAASMFQVPATNRVATVALRSDGGQVRIFVPATPTMRGGDFALYALANDRGALVPLPWFVPLKAASLISDTNSSALIISSLEPGPWQIAKFPDMQSVMAAITAGATIPVVRAFTIMPGSNVVIDLRR